jgi:hypothetical protein
LYLEAGFIIIHYKPPFLQSKMEQANQQRQAMAASQWVNTEQVRIQKEASAWEMSTVWRLETFSSMMEENNTFSRLSHNDIRLCFAWFAGRAI